MIAKRMLLPAMLALGLSLGAIGPAIAQSYPTRAVSVIVPLAPGGTTDVLARIVGQKLEQRLGKPFIIENRAGAGSLTGALAAVRSAPDGYTLFMAPTSAMAINVSLNKKLPYDPTTDFIPLGRLAEVPFVLVVNAALPVRSMADLIALAKEKPGQLSYGSAGIGTPHHILIEWLKKTAGIALTHVPYKGAAPALNDVVAGHVQVVFADIAPAVGLLAEGKIRALAVSWNDRVAAVATVPTLAEAGVPGLDATSWQMLVAPAGTASDIVERLHAELKGIMAQPEMKDQLVKLGMIPVDPPSIADTQGFVRSQIARWAKLVELAGLTASQ